MRKLTSSLVSAMATAAAEQRSAAEATVAAATSESGARAAKRGGGGGRGCWLERCKRTVRAASRSDPQRDDELRAELG